MIVDWQFIVDGYNKQHASNLTEKQIIQHCYEWLITHRCPMTPIKIATFSVCCMILLVSISGCTGLSSTTPTAEITSDANSSLTGVSEINAGEVINFDARESTTPSPSIITDYTWDFGDGETRMTKAGIISHRFLTPGSFEVELTALYSDCASILFVE